MSLIPNIAAIFSEGIPGRSPEQLNAMAERANALVIDWPEELNRLNTGYPGLAQEVELASSQASERVVTASETPQTAEAPRPVETTQEAAHVSGEAALRGVAAGDAAKQQELARIRALIDQETR
jgi:hypothetical protein